MANRTKYTVQQKRKLDAAWAAGLRKTGQEFTARIELLAADVGLRVPQVKNYINNKQRQEGKDKHRGDGAATSTATAPTVTSNPPRKRRRLNGFNIFHRDFLKSQVGPLGEKNQESGKRWQALIETEKDRYKQMAEAENNEGAADSVADGSSITKAQQKAVEKFLQHVDYMETLGMEVAALLVNTTTGKAKRMGTRKGRTILNDTRVVSAITNVLNEMEQVELSEETTEKKSLYEECRRIFNTKYSEAVGVPGKAFPYTLYQKNPGCIQVSGLPIQLRHPKHYKLHELRMIMNYKDTFTVRWNRSNLDTAEERALEEEEGQCGEEEERHMNAEGQRPEEEQIGLEEVEGRSLEDEEERAEEHRRFVEEEKKAEARTRLVEEEKRAEERRRLVEEEKRAEERRRLVEEEKKAEEHRRLVEEEKRAEERRRLVEEEKRAEERRRLVEKEKRAEEQRRLVEEEKRAEEQRRLVEEEKRAEERRRLVEEEEKRAEERHGRSSRLIPKRNLRIPIQVIPIWTRVRILSEEKVLLGEGQVVPGLTFDGCNIGNWRRKVLVTSAWTGPQEDISEHHVVSWKLLLLEATARPNESSTGSLTQQRINSTGPKLHKYDKAKVCATGYCQLPSTDDVKWVNCDGCKKWLHFHCAGLAQTESVETAWFCGCHRRPNLKSRNFKDLAALYDVLQRVEVDLRCIMAGEYTSWRHRLFTKHQPKERDRVLNIVHHTVQYPIQEESINDEFIDSVNGMVLPYDRPVNLWGEDKVRMEYTHNVLLPEAYIYLVSAVQGLHRYEAESLIYPRTRHITSLI